MVLVLYYAFCLKRVSERSSCFIQFHLLDNCGYVSGILNPTSECVFSAWDAGTVLWYLVNRQGYCVSKPQSSRNILVQLNEITQTICLGLVMNAQTLTKSHKHWSEVFVTSNKMIRLFLSKVWHFNCFSRVGFWGFGGLGCVQGC